VNAIQRRPSPRLVRVVAALVGLAFLGELSILLGLPGSGLISSPVGSAPLLRQLWLSGSLLVLITSLLDAWSISRMPAVTVRRTLPRSLALQDWADVKIEVECEASIPGTLRIHDDHPDSAEVEGLPVELPARARLIARSHYRLRPMRRGDARFGRPTLQSRSPLGLWNFTSFCGETASVRVYPNFAAVARFDSLMQDRHTSQVGIRKQQRRGEGLEFHQLRGYRQGDSTRQIDWKATSRRQELVSREYQDERDQRVIFLLDCSRRMRTKDGDLSHFDHSLNAMILLSHVALRGGDAVGLMSFGEEMRWLPTVKGIRSVNRILNTVYDLEATTLGNDFRGAARELCARQPRRSLVILLTHLRDEDLEDLLPGVQLLKRKHLVLVVNLREARLDEVLQHDAKGFDEAVRAIGAWQHQIDRSRVQDHIERHGTLTLDVTPSQLPARLINSYYAIKRSGEL
jgi:uncharacterized protein (DUF58 family)